MHNLAFLHLLQLSDSALPVGTAAHSFGLETMVAEGWLSVETLETFLRDYLAEAGTLECSFCLRGHSLATLPAEERLREWLTLNARLSAFKTARESRQASSTLGRRLLQLAQKVELHPAVPELLQATQASASESHYSLAFGLLAGWLEADRASTGLAYLQQALSGLISACQRLLPLGQSQASALLWRLHADALATVEACLQSDELPWSFTALPDLGSMRHPSLTTRLFIS